MELTQSSVEYGIGAPVPGLGSQHSAQSYALTEPPNQAPLRAPAQQDIQASPPMPSPATPPVPAPQIPVQQDIQNQGGTR